jgi:hypothetical protein
VTTDLLQDPIMQEAFQAKYDIATENGMDIRKVAAAIRAYNAANPPPPTPRNRKLIEGHPVGRSVLREGEGLAELRAIKEKLPAEYAAGKRSLRATASVRAPNKNRKPTAFRTSRAAGKNQTSRKRS